MERILVPTNFSMQAGWAIEAACYLALKAKAKVVLLHVVEYPAMESFVYETSDMQNGSSNAIAKVITRNKLYLKELTDNLMAIGVSVTNVVRYGNLFHAIKSTVSDYAVDLVVMGTAKRTRVEEVMDESRTEQVVKFSEAAVLTVHEKPLHNQYRNIVYATSSAEDVAHLPDLLTVAEKKYGATVHITTVNTPKGLNSDSELKSRLEMLATKNGLRNYTLNVVKSSSEEAGIIQFAESIRADLIVLATHGRKQLIHEIGGNIPQDLVNHSGIPVLTYRGTA